MNPRARLFYTALVLVVLHAAVACFLLGCNSTVTPTPVTVQAASYEGAEANSGVIELVSGGALISAHARDRYNALVALYGREFLPRLALDQGVTPAADGTFQITNEALQHFILMSAWHRMGRAPSVNSDPQ